MIRFLLLMTAFAAVEVAAQSETRLPAYVLELPESVADVLIAETASATLHRFVRTDTVAQFRDERYMSIGQRGPGKQRAWDRRTPLGVYFITEQLDTSRMHEKYGVTAFPLDYPNEWDRKLGRTGDGIWIHGVSRHEERRPPWDTDGCIALPNDELLALANDLKPLVTPVIVTRNLEWLPPERIESLRAEFRSALQGWSQSLESGDLHAYLSFYADDFEHRGMDRNAWIAFRLQTVAAKPLQQVLMDDVTLLADPEVDGLFLSRFRQTLVRDDTTIRTTKRLYWRRVARNDWRIVAEDNA